MVKKKGIWYYKCSGKGCKTNRSAKVLHEKYTQILELYSVPEDLQDLIVDELKKVLTAHHDKSLHLRDELQRKRSLIREQRDNVSFRYGLGEIPKSVYDITCTKLYEQLYEIERMLGPLEKEKSNLADTVDVTMLTISRLNSCWECASFKKRQDIQKIVFPEGLYWDKEKDGFRTIAINEGSTEKVGW